MELTDANKGAMVIPIKLTDKVAREIKGLAMREKTSPEQIVERAVKAYVRQRETLDETDLERSQRLHARIKARLRKRNPTLRRKPSRCALEQRMDQLSTKYYFETLYYFEISRSQSGSM